MPFYSVIISLTYFVSVFRVIPGGAAARLHAFAQLRQLGPFAAPALLASGPGLDRGELLVRDDAEPSEHVGIALPLGMHPLGVETLIDVLQNLIEHGATVVVIEHDLDMIANADYVIDMGPGGGETGGRIVAEGTPAQVAANPESLTGRYLAKELEE